MKRVFLLFIIIGICITDYYAQKNHGGSFSYCEEKGPRTLDPITSQDDLANTRLTTLLFDGLFDLNIEREPVKKLAESYYFSKDKLKITVKLKKGIHWSDGGEVNSSDVYSTFHAIRKSQNQYLKRMVSLFRDVTVDDIYTVTFILDKPQPEEIVLKKLIFKILPHYKIEDPFTAHSSISQKPVGSAHYKYIRRGPQDLEFNKQNNPRDEEGPYIDEITAYIINDIGTQIENFINKFIDLLLEIPPTEIARIQAMGFDVIPYNSNSFSFIACNFQNSVLAMQDVRKAITKGYNRSNVLEKVYQNQGEVISGPFPRGSSYFFSEIEPLAYDPSEARRLLERAGFTEKNNDGIRYSKTGAILEFSLIVPRNKKGDDYQVRVIHQFVSDMKNIGIKINIEDLEFENFLTRLKTERTFDLAYSTIVFDDAGSIFPFFHSSTIKPGMENFISYKNDEVDRLLKQERESTDENVKINLGKRLHRMLRDDCPYIFLWSLNLNAAVNPRIRNVRYSLTPFTFFGRINEWYIKE